MFTFVLFGTSLIWTGLGAIGTGTLLFTAAVFAARPAAFLPALLPARLSRNNRALIAWFGPRGLSSLLLVLLPVFAGLPGSERLMTICCLVVLCSVVLHGLSPIFLIRTPTPAPVAAVAAPLQNGRERQSETSGPSQDAVSPSPPERHSAGDLVDPEYITIADVQEFQRRAVPVIIVDARSERTYDESTEAIPGAVRLSPEMAVRTGAERRLPKDAVLAVLCA